MVEHVWRDAEVTYPDFQGTAQLDYKMTGESGFSLVGVDEEKWLVVGFDLGGGETQHEARLIALDRNLFEEHDVKNLPELVKKLRYVPVTELLLHDVDPYELLKSITHQFEMRLRTRSLLNQEIRVVALGDIPEQ